MSTQAPASLSLSPRKRAVFGVITAAISIALALGAAEAGLRGWEWWRRRQPVTVEEELDLLQANPHGTGSYRLKPNVRRQVRVGNRTVLVKTNSLGMPWREVALEKPAGRARIAFLGDSFTFGCWADTVEKSLVGVFESGVSGARWEVLNFGVGGYGFADMELLLREEVLRFSPDYVVVVSYNGNDFRDTFLGLGREHVVRGTVELDEANIRRRVPPELLVEDATISRPVEASGLKGLKQLALYRLLAPLLGWHDLTLKFAVNRNFTMLSFWSQVPYAKAALEAKDVALATLGRMDDLLAAHRARLAVAVLPTHEQVYSDRLAGPDFDLSFPQIYIQLFARERGLPYLDLLPGFRAHVERTGRPLYLKGDTHLNNEGHALAGRLLGDWFHCCVRASATLRPTGTEAAGEPRR